MSDPQLKSGIPLGNKMREGTARRRVGRRGGGRGIPSPAMNGGIATNQRGGQAGNPAGDNETDRPKAGNRARGDRLASTLPSRPPKHGRDGRMPAPTDLDHKRVEVGAWQAVGVLRAEFIM